MSPMVDKPDRWSTGDINPPAYIKYLSLTPHVESLQCIYVSNQESLCFCALEQNRPYQGLVQQVYFGADTERTAIPYHL